MTRDAPMPRGLDPVERIMRRITVGEDGCWTHTGRLNRDGYTQIKVGSRRDGSRRVKRTHRVMYEAKVGPVPEGLVLDHLCRNRACVNPEHLEPVTNRENVLRGNTRPAENVAKTHCPKGHEYAGSNLGRYGRSRVCRACKAAHMRDVRASRRPS